MRDRMKYRWSDVLLAAIVFLPLLGRTMFPRLRDKAAISLTASFGDPQMVGAYILLLYLIYRLLRKPSSLAQLASPALGPFVLIMTVAGASVLSSAFPLFSMWRVLEFAVVLLWGAVVFDRLREGGSPRPFITGFYAMSGLVLATVPIALWLDPERAWLLDDTGVRRLSVTSSFGLMGAYTIGPMAALLALAASARCVMKKRPSYLLYAIPCLWLMYASRSRTGFIIFAAGFVVCALYMMRLPGRAAATGLGLFIVSVTGAGWVAVQPDVKDLVILAFTRGHDQTNIMGLDGRLSIWTAALKAFSQSPLLGSGYGTYPAWIGSTGHFHNMFVELLVTVGIGGLVAALILSVLLMWFLGKLVITQPHGSVNRHILVLDGLLLGVASMLGNQTSAGAAYYSWELIGFVVVMACLPAVLKTESSIRAVVARKMPPVSERIAKFPLVSAGRRKFSSSVDCSRIQGA